jgi:hypothetical protein
VALITLPLSIWIKGGLPREKIEAVQMSEIYVMAILTKMTYILMIIEVVMN